MALRALLVALIVIVVSVLHYWHLSTVHEYDLHFSHLSNLEREMSFRTEQGFYYAFYKRLVDAPELLPAIVALGSDNRTEHPDTINAISKFNIYPEIFLAASYRTFVRAANFTVDIGLFNRESFVQCFTIDRGEEEGVVDNCDGLGLPTQYYLAGVFSLNGLLMGLYFLVGHALSGDSILGGLLVVAGVFANHRETTRVQWTPPLRESFGFPMFIAQALLTTRCLLARPPVSGFCNWRQSTLIALTTGLVLVSWQFGQFILLTQLAALQTLYLLRMLDRQHCLRLLVPMLFGTLAAIGLLGFNRMLLSSLYATALVWTVVVMRSERMGIRIFELLTAGVLALASTFLLKSSDDTHIVRILQSKLGDYKDFDVLMYTCYPAFDFLGWEGVARVKYLLALVALSGVLWLGHLWFRSRLHKSAVDKAARRRGSDRATLYWILQAGAFSALAVLIMRLKLLATPSLCILLALLCRAEIIETLGRLPLVRRLQSAFGTAALVGGIFALAVALQATPGYHQLASEYKAHPTAYNNMPLERLLEWVVDRTPPEASFAGPIPTMGNLYLSTGRRVFNHPHYESESMRNRTRAVYRLYSRWSVKRIYEELFDNDDAPMRDVDYYVLEPSWCSRRPKPGCSVPEMWDSEEPELSDSVAACEELLEGEAHVAERYFEFMFENDVYTVLRPRRQRDGVETA